MSESESYHQQASVSSEQIAAINLDAQTGFIDWLSHHRAPNSNGTIGLQQAEWLIRHDPELAQSYARQYVGEKTNQSIHQFQDKHAINEKHVQQHHDASKQRIAGSKEVDHAFTGYAQVLHEQAKQINLGSGVDKGAVVDVEKDFTGTGKDMSERARGIVNDGSQVMQDVIVAQSDKVNK